MRITTVDDKLSLSGAIDDYYKLVTSDIDAVINVRGELHDDINELSKRGIAYYWIPIPDWLPARKNQIEEFLYLVNKIDGRVLVHCEMGKGRSAMLVIAYLLECDKVKTIQEGLEYLSNKGHPIVDLWRSQQEKLEKEYGK